MKFNDKFSCSFKTTSAAVFALASTLACGAEDPAGQTPAESDWGERDDRIDSIDDDTGCKGLHEEPRLKLEWFEAADETRSVRVSNPIDVDGVVTLTTTVISAGGANSTELATLSIRAGESLIVPVLDGNFDARHSSLHVTGKAEFQDGSQGWATVSTRFAGNQELDDLSPESVARVLSSEELSTPPLVTRALIFKTFCFRYPGNFVVGTYEDYFAQGVPTLRPARGMRIRLFREFMTSPPVFEQELVLDNDGCTPVQSFSVGRLYRVFAHTEGTVSQVDLEVRDDAQGGVAQQNAFLMLVTDAPTQTVDFDPTVSATAAQAFNVYQAAAYILDRQWSGGATTLNFRVNQNTSNSTYSASSNTVNLEVDSHLSKWTIGHEMGHWAMEVRTDYPTGNTCGSNGHSSTSLENQRCAFNEGFANFFSALAFNNGDQSDCGYGGNNCDVGASPGSCTDKTQLKSAMMENCYASSQWPGNGNETDWARVLWNMRASSGVSTSAMYAWVDSADDAGTAWTPNNVYVLLNIRAATTGGELDARWDAHKFVNGIDH